MGMGGLRRAPADLPPGNDPAPMVLAAGWAPGPVWTGAKNLAPTGIRSPERPARSEMLYRLNYPGPRNVTEPLKMRQSARRPFCHDTKIDEIGPD
jgi:hypothetical protein